MLTKKNEEKRFWKIGEKQEALMEENDERECLISKL